MSDDYYEAHLIGGPFHGSTIRLSSSLTHYRIAAPPQTTAWKQSDPWTPTLKTGIYERTAQLRYDPINFQLDRDSHRFVYEWKGWE
jgi:hypothetical protein